MPLLTFISCHPDDEVISSGALLLRAKKIGYDIHLVWLTQGEGSLSDKKGERKAEAKRVAERLSAEHTFFDFIDMELKLGETIRTVDLLIKRFNPKVVVWPYGYLDDQHQDHVILHRAMLNIKKRHRYPNRCWLAAQPPIFDDGTFDPGLCLGFSEDILAKKHELMSFYVSEEDKYFSKLHFFKTKGERWATEMGIDSNFAEPFRHMKGNLPAELFFYDLKFHVSDNGHNQVEAYLDNLEDEFERDAFYWLSRLEMEGDDLPSVSVNKQHSEIYELNMGHSIFFWCWLEHTIHIIEALAVEDYGDSIEETLDRCESILVGRGSPQPNR